MHCLSVEFDLKFPVIVGDHPADACISSQVYLEQLTSCISGDVMAGKSTSAPCTVHIVGNIPSLALLARDSALCHVRLSD